MKLEELIERLKKEDPNKVISNGFGEPHSYRGYYDQLAFEPKQNVPVSQMLADAESSLGKVFEGYKGGDYEMGPYTDVNLANYGECGEELGATLLDYMLKDSK